MIAGKRMHSSQSVRTSDVLRLDENTQDVVWRGTRLTLSPLDSFNKYS